MTPRLSIIIATFNAAKYLNNALESIVRQKYTDWECVVVDGGSSDSTLDVLRHYKEIDERIRFITEEDRGIFDAFNKGWKLAKGEWIYYLGSDDVLKEDAFSNVDFSSMSSSDILYGNIEIQFPDGSVKVVTPKPINFLRYVMIANHQAILMKKKVISDLGGFNIDYPISADFDLTQRAYLCGRQFKYLDKCFARFSYSGLSSFNSKRKRQDHLKICIVNRASKFPKLFHTFFEVKMYLGYLQKKYIKHCL